MSINIRKTGDSSDITIVDLKGRLDVHFASEVEEQLNKMIEEGNLLVLVNLKEVEYLSSSGLRIFIATMRKLKENNGKLKLMNMSDAVKKIFKVVELIDMFEIYDSELQAVSSF